MIVVLWVYTGEGGIDEVLVKLFWMNYGNLCLTTYDLIKGPDFGVGM